MIEMAQIPWIEANQAFLVAEFARLKDRLKSQSGEMRSNEEARAGMEIPPAIDRLSDLFQLTAFEQEILLLLAGVEMDSGFAAACGEALGHPQRAYATFGLAMATLADPHWSALTPSRPLRHFRLIEIESGYGLTSSPLRIDERILHYLAGVNLLDRRLASIVHTGTSSEWIADVHKTVAFRAVEILRADQSKVSTIHFSGDDAQGQQDAAGVIAEEFGRQLFVAPAENLPAPGPELDQFAQLWEREARLAPGILLIQCGSAGITASARQLAERLVSPVMIASNESMRLSRPILRFDVDKPAAAEQRILWEKALGEFAPNYNGTLDALSSQFRLSAKTIFSTCAQSTQQDLWEACRSQARPRMDDLAQRIVPSAGWEDLVLPDLQTQTLRQISAQVRHRLKVYEAWGFASKGRRGLGVSVLFAGESGTGKTLAAEVLARELALDVYRIDLSAVVSKYIGETEKNLKRVFDAAEEGGALLLFDEADALFGKRSDVKDSHDRYANIEVSYLLQRMEEYHGLAVLTTNLRSAVDRAFTRRLRFTVNFPFPDAAQREVIWSRIFPRATPTRGLDLRKLAQLNVAGGNIRNIALNAAFLAADAGRPVEMQHLLQAARLEAQKMERPLAESEIRGWA